MNHIFVDNHTNMRKVLLGSRVLRWPVSCQRGSNKIGMLLTCITCTTSKDPLCKKLTCGFCVIHFWDL
jgi:hypothetical protein